MKVKKLIKTLEDDGWVLVKTKGIFRRVFVFLENDGWLLVKTKGSHRQFKHSVKKGKVTVSGKLNVDIPTGTLYSVLKQANL